MEKNSIYVIYDRNVEDFALKIAEGRPALAITADEEHKTMDTVLEICRWLLAQGADRDAIVWAVGGGVTTDLAGFAASIYKRGVRYANYPTTLLCQVDAGVGGKTGVNLDGYKNMVGVIKFPIYTRILPEVLQTLPARELRSGAAEMLKTFLLGDAAHYAPAVSVLTGIRQDGCERWQYDLQLLIAAAAAVKADIVGRDPFERGERRKLNLGHTFAHGLETEARRTGSDLTHGEAVAIGIVLAARLSEKLGVAGEGLAVRLEQDFRSCGLPVDCPYALECLEEAMSKDKKAEGSVVHFILPVSVGTVVEKDLPVAQAVALLRER
jgi:3-dehydroquinate synthetase